MPWKLASNYKPLKRMRGVIIKDGKVKGLSIVVLKTAIHSDWLSTWA